MRQHQQLWPCQRKRRIEDAVRAITVLPVVSTTRRGSRGDTRVWTMALRRQDPLKLGSATIRRAANPLSGRPGSLRSRTSMTPAAALSGRPQTGPSPEMLAVLRSIPWFSGRKAHHCWGEKRSAIAGFDRETSCLGCVLCATSAYRLLLALFCASNTRAH